MAACPANGAFLVLLDLCAHGADVWVGRRGAREQRQRRGRRAWRRRPAAGGWRRCAAQAPDRPPVAPPGVFEGNGEYGAPLLTGAHRRT
jgi:hypothetical protein